nr:Non structural polyprotein CDS [Astacus astacus]
MQYNDMNNTCLLSTIRYNSFNYYLENCVDESENYARFMVTDTDFPTEVRKWLDDPRESLDEKKREWKNIVYNVPSGPIPMIYCSCLSNSCIGCKKVNVMTDEETANLIDEVFTWSTLPVSSPEKVIKAMIADRSETFRELVNHANAVINHHAFIRAFKLMKYRFMREFIRSDMSFEDGDYNLAMSFLRKYNIMPNIFNKEKSEYMREQITLQEMPVAQILDVNVNMPPSTVNKLDSLLDMLHDTIQAFNMKASHLKFVTSLAVNLILFFKSGCTLSSLGLVLTNIIMTSGLPSTSLMEAVSYFKEIGSNAYNYLVSLFSSTPVSQGPEETLLPLGSLIVGLSSVGLLKKLPNAGELTAYAQHFAIFGRALQGMNSITDIVQRIALNAFAWCYERWYGVPYELKDYTAAVPELACYFDDVAQLVSLDEKQKIKNDRDMCKKVEDTYTRGLGILRRLGNIKAPPQVMSVFNTHHMIMTRLYADVDKSGAFNSGPRVPPVVVQLFGGSGVGKSGVAYPLMQEVLAVDGLHKDWANQIYCRNVEQEFWDGYDNQRVCYYDDFGQCRDSQTKPNLEFMEIVRTANIAPFPLHMAELSEKAKSRFTSRFVLLTSNVQSPPIASMTCPEAFVRRLDFSYKVDIEDRVAYQQVVNGNLQKRLDPSLVERFYGVPMTQDIYRFYKVDKQTLQVTNNPLTFADVVGEITREYKRRYFSANNTVDYLNNRVILTDIPVAQVAGDETDKVVDQDSEYDPYYESDIESIDYDDYNPYYQESDDDRRAIALNFVGVETTPNIDMIKDTLGEDKKEFTIRGFTSDSLDKLKAFFALRSRDIVDLCIVVEEKFKGIVFAAKNVTVDKITKFNKRSEWLKSKATDCVGKLKEFINVIMEKVRACPARVMLTAAAILIPIAIRFWPESKSGCRVKSALLRVVEHDSHWNIVNAFGTRTCYRKCQVCDTLKMGGVPCLSANNSMEDVVRQMIDKLRRVPPFGTEVESNDTRTNKLGSTHVESNDNRTNKIVLPDLESNDNRTDRVNKPNVESNENRTGKVNKPNVESNDNITRKNIRINVEIGNDVLGAPEAQGLLDPNTQELFQNKVLRNTYRLVRERNGVECEMMNVTFLKGHCAITARHLLDYMKDGDIVHLRNVYLKSISLPWHAIQRVKPVDSTDDICILVFPNDYLPMQIDITKHFIDNFNMRDVARGAATLATFRNVKIEGKEFPHQTFLNCLAIEAHDEILHYNDPATGKARMQRAYYSYRMDTQKGDCGSLLGIRSSLIQRKIIGMHFAGNPGCGFAVPLSQGRIRSLLDSIPVESQISLDLDYTPVVSPPGDFIPLFSVPKEEASTTGNKSSLVRTPLFDVLEQHTMERAHLRPVGGVDPMEKSLEKAGGDLVYIDPRSIDTVENAVIHKLNPSGNCRVLTYQETIEGIVGDEWICPVNRMASAGYPWSKKAEGKPGKTKWLGRGEEYCFDNKELLDNVTKAEEMMKRGERPLFIFQDTLKDEKRPLEKVDAIKTRTFAACPLPLVLLFRKYFLDSVKQIMSGRNYNEIAVGTNVRSMDWYVIARLLKSKGEKVIAGDFSNFDGSLQPQLLYAVGRILENFYVDTATPEETRIRFMLFREVVNSIHIRGRDIYMWTHSQPSGGPLTVIINSIYNMLVMRLCWLDIMGGKFNMRDFDRCVALNTYGDDNVANISDEVIDLYNQETISTAMVKFGMTYTDESKSGKIIPYRKLEDISFLKRRFVQRGAVFDAPLEERSLHEMVQWTRQCVDIQEATATTVEQAAVEWGMHGEEVYNHQIKRLKDACRHHLTIQPLLLTFDEVLQELDSHKY